MGEESGAAAARVAQEGHAAADRRIADAGASEVHSMQVDGKITLEANYPTYWILKIHVTIYSG